MITIEELKERWFNAYPELMGITGDNPIQCYGKKDVDECLAGIESVPHTDNSAVIARLLEELRWRKFPDEKVFLSLCDAEYGEHAYMEIHNCPMCGRKLTEAK